MKLKLLVFMSLLLAAMGCGKDEPFIPNENSIPQIEDMKVPTPKGYVGFKLVDKQALPSWLQSLSETIERGYIMKAGSGENLLYFVYDYNGEIGQHYDANGNAAKDNPKLKDWIIIYYWGDLFVPKK